MKDSSLFLRFQREYSVIQEVLLLSFNYHLTEFFDDFYIIFMSYRFSSQKNLNKNEKITNIKAGTPPLA